MTTSSEAIYYLKKSLDKRYYVSMFISGSLPKELEPGTDLDLFIVMKDKFRNNFFNNLDKIMKNFIKKNKKITYAFFRGPIKYKNKALIHFIIYTDIPTKERVAFRQELLQILKNHKKNAKILYGKSINDLVKGIDLEDKEKQKAHIEKIRKRQRLFKKTGYIAYRKWKKVNGHWVLRRTWIKPGKFLKPHIKKYYQKNLVK